MVVEVSGLLAELLVLLTRLPWLETLSGELSLLWDGRSAFTMILLFSFWNCITFLVIKPVISTSLLSLTQLYQEQSARKCHKLKNYLSVTSICQFKVMVISGDSHWGLINRKESGSLWRDHLLDVMIWPLGLGEESWLSTVAGQSEVCGRSLLIWVLSSHVTSRHN